MAARQKLHNSLTMLVFLMVLIAPATAASRIITVNNNGLADFNNIQAAINDSNDGDTITVADGIYTGPGNQDIDYFGKAITVRSENGPKNCIIDCQGSMWTEDRAFYFHTNEDTSSVLNGFTITNGSTPGCGAFPGGGAILCSSSSPTITNCIIRGNRASGGCVHPDSFGGGICCYQSSPTITNCIISGNFAYSRGGGIYCRDSNPTIRNCTFTGNRGSAICSGSGSNVTVTNCIFWDDTPEEINLFNGTLTAAHSDFKDGWHGEGNIDADPCFAEPGYWDPNGTRFDPWDDFWVDGDYHLKSQAGRWDPNSKSLVQDDVTSPCIDAGNQISPIGLEPFPNGGIINMGAYGGTAEASKSYFGEPVCETIVAGDINGDCKVDFADFAIMAGHWLDGGVAEPGIIYQIEDCGVEPRSLAAASDESGHLRFSVRVEGSYIHFEDIMSANCCPEELGVEMTVEDNLIVIYETEYTPEGCRCMCGFPITATLGPFEPGTYTLEVYQEPEIFIGSTTVTIGSG